MDTTNPDAASRSERIARELICPTKPRRIWIGLGAFVVGTIWFFLATRIFGMYRGTIASRALSFAIVVGMGVLIHWLLTSTGGLVEGPSPPPSYQPKHDPGFMVSLLVFALLSLPSIPLSALMITLGRRVIVQAAPVQDIGIGPSVVYLRSFADDTGVLSELFTRCRSVLRGARFDDNVWGEDYSPTGATPEEWLASAYSGCGSFLAIGRPGERLPPVGAARIYVGNNWQYVVKELIAGAHTVIIRLGTSAGLWWEIETVLSTVPQERILFQLPEWGLFGIWRRRAYREFRQRTQHLMPHPLPRNCLFVRFIAFDGCGKPVMMRPSWWRILFWPLVSPEKSFRSALNYKLGKP